MVTNFFEDGLDRRRESGVAIEIGGALEYISEKQHDRDAKCRIVHFRWVAAQATIALNAKPNGLCF